MLATLLDLAAALGLSFAAGLTLMVVHDSLCWAFGVILDPDEDADTSDPWEMP